MATVALGSKTVILVLGGTVSGTSITGADIDLHDGTTCHLIGSSFDLGQLNREEAWIEPWGGGANYAPPVLANYADRKTMMSFTLRISGANWAAVRSTYTTIRNALDKAAPGPLYYSTNGQTNMDTIPIFRSPVDPLLSGDAPPGAASGLAHASVQSRVWVPFRIWRGPYVQSGTAPLIG